MYVKDLNVHLMCSFPLDVTYGTLPWGTETLTVLYPKNKEPYVCITELNRKVRGMYVRTWDLSFCYKPPDNVDPISVSLGTHMLHTQLGTVADFTVQIWLHQQHMMCAG